MKIEELLPQEAYVAIGRISECKEESVVAALTMQIVRALGAESYVYSTLIRDDKSEGRESYRYFIGCDPAWCRLYNERKWFMNDPYVEYARSNIEPIYCSKMRRETAGQVEMLETAKNYGFRSGMVIPTHGSSNASERMGLLYIGSNMEPEHGEGLFMRHRIFFQSLGMELLFWWTRKLKALAMQKYRLEDLEVDLLQYSKKGLKANEIAAKLDISPTKVYRLLNVVKDKFNVDKIEEAVSIASFEGLLG